MPILYVVLGFIAGAFGGLIGIGGGVIIVPALVSLWSVTTPSTALHSPYENLRGRAVWVALTPLLKKLLASYSLSRTQVWKELMDTPLLVIIVLGVILVLLLSIGDVVGAVAFGLVVLVLGWAYQSTRRERLGEKREKQRWLM